MKTNILKSMEIHFDTLQVKMKKEETKNDLAVIFPKCTKDIFFMNAR
jgi:hypothetical protein